MNLAGQAVVVTGGGSGIGAALCRALRAAGVARIVVADIDAQAAQTVAAEVGGTAFACDVSDERQVIALVDAAEQAGPIGLFCSNAGIAVLDAVADDATSADNAAWARSWGVNVMAHVYAARALVPRMAARGGGAFLHTVSAAGLLSQIGSASYSTTKHAAIGFAENLAIMHRHQGIRVSVLCPQGVDTPMLRAMPDGPQARDGVLSADDVAACALAGLQQETFLILPHPKVLDYLRRKAADYDRWLAGMSRLRAMLASQG